MANTFIVFRFLMSALLAAGGIACIVFGYRLFRDGTGIVRAIDKIDWKSKQTKVSAAGMSVGSVLMLTSVGWGYFATNSIPKLEVAAAGNIKVTQAPSLNQKVDWASAIGLPVQTTDKHAVGTITGVLVKPDSTVGNFVVSGKDAGPFTLETSKFKFNQTGAVVDFNKEELDKQLKEIGNTGTGATKG